VLNGQHGCGCPKFGTKRPMRPNPDAGILTFVSYCRKRKTRYQNQPRREPVTPSGAVLLLSG
jgi:hypothetical protein